MVSERSSSDSSKPPRRSSLPILLPVLTFGLAGLLFIWYQTPPAPTPAGPPQSDQVHGTVNTPFISPGINNPLIVQANEVDLPDSTVVIGVEISGRFRAYKLDAFRYVTSHVVNDVVEKTPVSVTYCDRMDCVNVFTDPKGDKPLPIDVGGYRERMFLKVGNDFFFQDDGNSISDNVAGKMPYPTQPFTRTTWKEWKTSHPATEIYTGGQKKS